MAQQGLDLIKYILSAALFLDMRPQVEEAAAVLEAVETRLEGHPSRDWKKVQLASTGLPRFPTEP